MNKSKLIVTHHSPERTDEELLEMETKARQRFAGISFAREGDILVMNNS